MATRIIDRLDLSDKRKVFAVGDIHGDFDLLEAHLLTNAFDREKDFLISVGDLVDRGPKSHVAIEWAQKPWFKHIVGNHEEFCKDSASGNAYWHYQNGGSWMQDLSPEEQREHARILMDAPYLLEVLTPGKKKIGFVHADIPYNDWEENIAHPHVANFAWSRERIKHADKNDCVIKGIDWVIMGHTPVKVPIRKGNCVWIDTGAFFSNVLTVIDVDKDIDNIALVA